MSPEQKHRAYEIAAALNDLHSLRFHEKCVRLYPKEALENILNAVLSNPVITNRAAYYTSEIKRYATNHRWD